MSSNVGLATPRGSGTSGYVQRNLSALKPRDNGFGAPYPPRNSTAAHTYSQQSESPRLRQPDQEILAHDREREIEVQVFELRDRLEEAGAVGEDEVERRCDELRTRLLSEMDAGGRGRGGVGKGEKGKGKKGWKPHQVHELAEAKIQESERLRKALGIKDEREGKTWDDAGDRNGGRHHDGEREGMREREREREKDARR